MADKFLVSTTGTEDTIVLDDIAGLTIIHPTTDLDLYTQADKDEVDSSQDLQDAIDRGALKATDESGNPITNVESVDDDIVYYKEDDRITSTTSTSFRERLSLDYIVQLPGTYRFEWYLEYSQYRRGYPIEINIKFNDKLISDIIEDNYYARKDYFRVMLGFDVINIDENNLKGSIKILYRSLRGRRSVYIKNLKLVLERIHTHNI